MKDSTDEAKKLAAETGVLTDATTGLAISTSVAAMTQDQLNQTMGPVASRNVDDYSNGVLKTSVMIDLLAKSAKLRADAESAGSAATNKQAEADKKHAETIAKKNQAIKDYLTAYSGYSKSIADTANGFVSLADAQRTSAESGGEPNGGQNIGQAFLKQIQDAKHFATNLKTLIGMGLGQAGLSQLLNLGPAAGLVVTDDMILGVGSLQVGGLNAQLQELSNVSSGLGGAAAGAFMTTGGGTVNNITVNASLVSTPAQIGQDIIDAIQKAQRLSGQVFVAA